MPRICYRKEILVRHCVSWALVFLVIMYVQFSAAVLGRAVLRRNLITVFGRCQSMVRLTSGQSKLAEVWLRYVVLRLTDKIWSVLLLTIRLNFTTLILHYATLESAKDPGSFVT